MYSTFKTFGTYVGSRSFEKDGNTRTYHKIKDSKGYEREYIVFEPIPEEVKENTEIGIELLLIDKWDNSINGYKSKCYIKSVLPVRN